MQYSDWKKLLEARHLPAAVADLDAFDRNVALLARICGEKPLRLATKSVRVPELIRRALAHGKPFEGLMCYSAQEARYLAEQGFDDVLVAYPTVQRSDIDALLDLHRAGKRVSLVVDEVEHLRAIQEAIDERGRSGSAVSPPFPVVIEIDLSLRLWGGMHIGVRRSPLRSVADLRAFLGECAKLATIQPIGMMAYEAQVAGLGDQNPFKKWTNAVASWIRLISAKRASRLRSELAEAFKESGNELRIFNGGGTGSLNLAVNEPWLTEVTAGSALLSPHLFDYFSNIRFEPAAFFVLQVVRSSDPGFVTCQGGGYVASGEPGWDRLPRPWLPEGLGMVSIEGVGEVQTPLTLPQSVTLQVGDPVIFRHAKAGELAERFNEYVLLSGGQVVGSAKTYRGLGLSFF